MNLGAQDEQYSWSLPELLVDREKKNLNGEMNAAFTIITNQGLKNWLHFCKAFIVSIVFLHAVILHTKP